MSTRHSDPRQDRYNAVMYLFWWLVSPHSGLNWPIPGLQPPNPSLTRKGKGIAPLSAFRPYPARWPHGERNQEACSAGGQTGQQEAEARTGAGKAAARGPHPCVAAQPYWGMGLEAGACPHRHSARLRPGPEVEAQGRRRVTGSGGHRE